MRSPAAWKQPTIHPNAVKPSDGTVWMSVS
jgi:hypothetical protein